MEVYCEDCISCYHNCGIPLCAHIDFRKEKVIYVFKKIELDEKLPYCKDINHDGMCPKFQKKIKWWKAIWKLIKA